MQNLEEGDKAFYLCGVDIESTSMRSDIVIRIWDGTDLIVETEAPAETLPVTIPISHLEKGTLYRLELTNQWGDCLNGTFQL